MASDVRNVDELLKKVLEQEEELKKIVSVREGHIVINVVYEYNIELARCDTLEKILAWTIHLCEKNWMTTDILERFMRVAAKENGLKLPAT